MGLRFIKVMNTGNVEIRINTEHIVTYQAYSADDGETWVTVSGGQVHRLSMNVKELDDAIAGDDAYSEDEDAF